MASSAPNRAIEARAAAVLTTSEVAAKNLDINETWGGLLTVQIDFTLGSLTNGIFRYFVSMDGTTYYPIDTLGGGVVSHTFTADTTRALQFQCAGWKFFRTSVQGTGTVTSSSATLTYRYVRRGSQ